MANQPTSYIESNALLAIQTAQMDDEDDYALRAWAGVIPLERRAGAPEPDPRLAPGLAPPPYVSPYRRPGSP